MPAEFATVPGREQILAWLREELAEREGFEPDSDPLSNQQVTDSEDNSVPSNPHKSP
jgi:hypothetical protein